jgi:hypothetical protein
VLRLPISCGWTGLAWTRAPVLTVLLMMASFALLHAQARTPMKPVPGSATAASSSPAETQQNSVDFRVLSAKPGNWRQFDCHTGQIISQTPLRFADPLKPEIGNKDNQMVACVSGDENAGSISVEFSSGLVTYACDSFDPDLTPPPGKKCAKRVKPTSTLSDSERAALHKVRLMQVLGDVWKKGEQRYFIVPASRGGAPEAADAVVLLHGNQVNLGSVLRDLPSGQYMVRFRPHWRAHTEPSTDWVPVNWDEKEAIVNVSGLSTGLQELELESSSSRMGPPAWILVANDRDYAALADTYRQVQDIFRQSRVQNPRPPARAVLEALSRQASTKNPK